MMAEFWWGAIMHAPMDVQVGGVVVVPRWCNSVLRMHM